MARKTNDKLSTSEKHTQNEKSKECMRKLREKIKNDLVLQEEEKETEESDKVRKEAEKVKLINDVSEREKRRIRKEWKERSRRSYYLKKSRETMKRQAQEYTPPSTPICVSEDEPGPSRQSIVGRKIVRKNRKLLKKEIQSRQKSNCDKLKKCMRYRKKLHRIKKRALNTPSKRVGEMLKGQNVPPEVKKKLLFGEVLKDQLKVNFKDQKQLKEKRTFVKCTSGNIIKKYRIKNVISSVNSRHLVQKKVLFLWLKEKNCLC